jgi:c-di-GMP-binding flagellar brake protein YcgR
VLQCETVSCQAELDNVRLHFVLEPTAGRLRYSKVFAARVPDLMIRVQRREYYRLAIEPADGVRCTLLLPQPGGAAKETEVELVDLSGGGMAFRVPLALGAQLRLHVELPGCTLTLADAGALGTRVRIRNLMKHLDADGVAWVRAGAQFLDLRVGHIAQVQRLIGAIERRRRDEERRRAELEARRADAVGAPSRGRDRR